MVSRRDFIQAGIAASTLPIMAGNASAATLAALTRLPATPIYKVIFDSRFASSVAFGAEAARRGASVHAIRGDITDLWYDDLDPRWKQEPVAIAGLTGHGALFCLERLAWDHGMRVVYRGVHSETEEGTVEHVLTGHESVIGRAASLPDHGTRWARHVAALTLRCPAERGDACGTTLTTPLSGETGNGTEPLYSWVIAPARRA